jgi:hypothetical protein
MKREREEEEEEEGRGEGEMRNEESDHLSYFFKARANNRT